jgi:uncharacterized cupin superfamily protein
MGTDETGKIRVCKPADVIWEEAEKEDPADTDPPGNVFSAIESADGAFSCGFWQRDVEDIHFDMAFTEVCYIISGEARLEGDDGTVVTAGPGDILVVPQGATGRWTNLSPVKKFWATYEQEGRMAAI